MLCGLAVMPTQQKSRSRSVSPTLPDAESESQVATLLALRADSWTEEALPAVMSVAEAALEVDVTSPENIVFESLQSLLCTGVFNSAAQNRLRRACASIDASGSASLDEHIDDRWKARWSSFPEFLRSDIPGRQTEMKNAWFQNGFEGILQSYVDAQRAASFIFAPELSVEALEEGLRVNAAGLVSQVKEKHVPGIEEAVSKAFQSELERIPTYLQAVVAQDLRKHFLVRRYFDIIRDILRSATTSEPFRFEPELVVASIQDPLLREHAAHVVSRVREAHVPVISQAVQRAYARELDKVPQYLRTGLEEAIRHHFLLEQYIPIISSIVSRADVPSAFTWEQPFAMEKLSEEAARHNARELCLLVGLQHVPLMEKKVAERFGADTARIDPSFVALHAETLRANWMRENYFGLLREVICGAARTSPVCYDFGILRQVSSSATRSAPPSVFFSPKKRARSVAPLRP